MRKLLKISTFLALGFFSLSSALAAQPTQKDWTLLVYLNGNNSLDSFGPTNLIQMEKVGSNNNLNIVVQWASLSANDTKRLYVTQANDTTTVSSPVIQDMGQVDMGDYHSLEDFIHWGVENYPAKHYIVDVWDHGAGWHSIQDMAMGGGFHTLDISWDDNSGHFISTEQLGQAMADAAQVMGHKVDIYGSDACMMGMIEVANEMSDSVSLFMGSQEVEPGAGWPYADWLSRWANTRSADPTTIVTSLVDTYVKSYEGGSNGTDQATFAAYDLSKLDALDSAIADFGTKVRALDAASKTQLMNAVKNVQVFTYTDYADLIDLMKQISSSRAPGIGPQDVAEVMAAAKAFIMANADTDQFQKANGLSIWMPQDSSTYGQNSARYKGLKFNTATDWNDTLNFLLQGSKILN